MLKYSLDKCKIQEMCKKAVSKDSFTLKYCSCRYITQEMCEKAVDAYILTSKVVPDWSVIPKILKTFAYCLFFLIIWMLNIIIETLMMTLVLLTTTLIIIKFLNFFMAQ